VEELGASDHKSITFSIEWKYDSSDNLVTVPDFRLADYNGLREHLSSVDWGNEVSYQYDSFLNTIHAAQRTFIPYKEIRSNRNDPKWMNNRLKYLLGHKKGIYRRIKRGEGHLMNQYIDIKRDIKRGIRKAKRDYEIKVARDSKTNPKSFFQVYRTKVRDKIGPLKNNYGHLTDKENEMCSIFNNYFLSVFTQEDTNNIPVINFYSGLEEKLCNITVTSEMVVKQIDRLKQNKSPGPDEVFSRVLKECKMELCEPLTNIFNLCLQTGVVSDMWKMANVIPIFKTRDKSLPSNYRPISLTSIVGKLLESIIAEIIRSHLDKHSLINDTQHGFTRGRSCLTNLLTFFSKAFEAVDHDKEFDIIYLDFSKAFDSSAP
ncbi:hypothetical protein OTU49_017424, partial [Cherax quadricarinatus]